MGRDLGTPGTLSSPSHTIQFLGGHTQKLPWSDISEACEFHFLLNVLSS